MPITLPAEALYEFDRLCPSTECPALTSGEINGEVELILARHKRGELWAATTTKQIGAMVIPTLANRNGHRYKAVEYTTTGTNQQTGITEPDWPTDRREQVTDGVIVWQEDGFDWDGVLWDFIAAAYDGWLKKAAKSVARNDFQDAQGLAIKSSQLFDHCLKQADQFRPVYVL